ncbi:Hemin transport system permease protein HmuU [Nitrospira tepida]|uniref:Hemin transport system permease protein HmuU n=1 Tax=Nitrospira tepida TaxID=2973512 RepID=A0AA86TBN9_9BACT|nr:iron ABC transporter permease [Nitrospira tepida]CAI4034023.1 Hemin transport system permease protein HmuU [Nitrospira tepida]
MRQTDGMMPRPSVHRDVAQEMAELEQHSRPQSGPANRPAPRTMDGSHRIAGSRSRRAFRVLGLLTTGLILLMILCLQFGTEYIGLQRMADLILHALRRGDWGRESIGTSGMILFHVRLPRVLLSVIVGASLACVGVVLQALLRNPLADPYVVGVSSGAAFGAALAILFGIGTSFLALTALPLCAFAGGLLSLLLVYRLGATQGRLSIHSLLLAGVILNAIFSALIMFSTLLMDPNRSFGLMAWLMGTLTLQVSPGLTVLLGYILVGLALLLTQLRSLNLMTLGEEAARSCGVDTERVKKRLFVTSALVTGAVVSVSGMIGFVGMVVPHAVRLLFGADHRLLFPASALVGGMALLVADTAARTLLAPTEIPVGIVTALAGGPLFLYLLLWRRDRLA